MQNHLKVLLSTFCFGIVCILLFNIFVNKDSNFIRQRKQIIQLNSQKKELKQEEQTTTVQDELSPELCSKIRNEFKIRNNKIKYFCTTIENNINSHLQKTISKLVIDIKHSLTWCPIFKSASSMWMKNFAVLSGFSTTESLHSVHDNLFDYSSIVKQKFQHRDSVEEKLKQISNTTKFMVVRHPFERLLSAYRDKLEHMQGREYYYKRYGQYITHRYRAKQSNLTSLEPTFTEFLQFIAKEKHFDEHWIPFFESCQPCSIDYDYIFKFESFNSEYNFFIEENNLQYYLDHSKGKRLNTSSQGITNDLIAEKYFEPVPASLLLSIFKIYELDFLLFSYSPVKYYYMTNDAHQKPYNFVIKN